MAVYLGGRVMTLAGDITVQDADAIVNAANSSLMGGGGVDGAIHHAGGPEILEACRAIRRERYPDGLPTGQAAATTAGKLHARYVIHTVGPVWHGGAHDEDRLLADCYRNSLLAAEELGCESIAFPAISTGVYRFPKVRAAEIASRAVREFLAEHASPREVRFVFFSDSDLATFDRAQDF